MHITRRALRALIPACAGLIAMTALTQAQTVKLRFAIFSPDTEQTYLTVFKPFAEAVNKENAGVEIELFPNGALGRNPAQQAQMVLDGVADIAWVVASYTPGRFQENEVFELPGLFRSSRSASSAPRPIRSTPVSRSAHSPISRARRSAPPAPSRARPSKRSAPCRSA